MEEQTQFGMTEQDVKESNMRSLLERIKLFLESIEPAVVKIFSTIIYYLLRFIKAFVSTTVRMIMGKEV